MENGKFIIDFINSIKAPVLVLTFYNQHDARGFLLILQSIKHYPILFGHRQKVHDVFVIAQRQSQEQQRNHQYGKADPKRRFVRREEVIDMEKGFHSN
ncbi:MAG: hypothetical protein IJP76_09915 [Paludibacteraceae bacterium]|nr:hypothetical protein [Paludibacteraceae bacterium]MBQ6791741.1 hypothetical protein [Paludibacteraceae bacterium]